MTTDELRETVITILLKYSKTNAEFLRKNTPLLEMMDSLTMLEVIFVIEERFGIKVEDDELALMRTLDDIVFGLEKKIKGCKVLCGRGGRECGKVWGLCRPATAR